MAKGIFHLKWPRRKHEENSPRGIREAARKGYARIDLDLSITKDGVVVGCHWPRPMIRDGFRDPKKQLKRTRTVASMTWAEVSRLRTKDGYRIWRVEDLIAVCAEEGVEPLFEPKDDARFEDVAPWHPIKKACDAHGLHPTGYSLRSNGRGKKRVAAMNAAGIPAHLLKH